MREVDLLSVLAPGEALRPEALAALADQGAVKIRHFFAEGRARPGETRVDAIVRARNRVKREGQAPWAMFLDRDVVLPARALECLVLALEEDPACAALAIDYGPPQSTPAPHVAMGAVMFRQSVLERLEIRCEPGVCECSCCCADLRAMGYRIDYLPGFRAEHIRARLSF